MTRIEKLQHFFSFLPKDRKPTEKDYREAVLKTGDVTQIIDVILVHVQECGVGMPAELHEIEKAKNQAGLNESVAIVKTFSDIQPEKINWLWRNHIANGKLTILAGDPGLGKSQGSLDIAARLSRGDSFPDGSPGVLGDTIILTSEDDPGDTIRPRLDALNADVARIHFLQGERNKDGTIARMTLEKTTIFFSAINQIRFKGHEVKLLIIDPFNGFMGDGDSNSNEDTRKAVDAICSLAEREGFAIIGIMHLNKGKGSPMTRILGSMAWVARARAAFVFVKDKETNRRLFLPLKNNLGSDIGGLQYSIKVKALYNGGIDAPYISWEGKANDDLGDILCASNRYDKERPTPEQDEIVKLLQEAKPNCMVNMELADKLGKSPQSISNALKKLRTKGQVVNMGYGKWTTPDEPEQLSSDKF